MQQLDLEHEQVLLRHDSQTGLTAVIALHSTALGPAAGGCRRWRYADFAAAQEDALRLSAGMTYKNALAGISFGGGKSVILQDQNTRPTPAQLHQFGRWLNELQGSYVTAEDVGMGVAEMHCLAEVTRYVSGLGDAGIGGDPSPKTAYGVFLGLKAAVRHKLGVDRLKEVRVAVQGLGSVGMALCQYLAEAGAHLIVTDIDSDRLQYAETAFNARAVEPNALMSESADVFSPCALGGTVTATWAESTEVSVVAGAANNQLAGPEVGEILARRGVLFAPDFVINAAGVISVAQEYLCSLSDSRDDDVHQVSWAQQRIEAIPHRLVRILNQADEQGRSTEAVAQAEAKAIIAQASLPNAELRSDSEAA